MLEPAGVKREALKQMITMQEAEEKSGTLASVRDTSLCASCSVLQALLRHGSVGRDRLEGNLDSVNFPEFSTAIPQNTTWAIVSSIVAGDGK
jgi:hypothetical protein